MVCTEWKWSLQSKQEVIDAHQYKTTCIMYIEGGSGSGDVLSLKRNPSYGNNRECDTFEYYVFATTNRHSNVVHHSDKAVPCCLRNEPLTLVGQNTNSNTILPTNQQMSRWGVQTSNKWRRPRLQWCCCHNGNTGHNLTAFGKQNKTNLSSTCYVDFSLLDDER